MSSQPPPETAVRIVTFGIDTTRGSVLHRLVGLPPSQARAISPAAYVLAVGATYLPLAAAALLGPLPLLDTTSALRLPFLRDWNVAFMFLVSFPCIIILTLTDDRALANALERVQLDGTVTVSESDAIVLGKRWQRLFRRTNIAAQWTGAAVGIVLSYFNYATYAPAPVGYWIADGGRLVPAGFVFIFCIFLFYAVIPIYILRSAAMSLLLKDLVAHAELRMLPFHPDKSGGLRPVGRLGLRNQYGLTIFGVNVVLLVSLSLLHLDVPRSLYGLIVAAGIAYLILGPIVFIGPLLPFRGGMLRTKSELMGEVAQRLRLELSRLRGQLATGPITKDDEELVDRLRKIGAVIDELPVWPFDAGTLRRFLAAFVIPVIGAVGYPLATALANSVLEQLRP